MTHPSPTALEERKLGYWYVEDADGAIARIQSGIASTRLYEYGGELPYIFGGLGRSYAQGIADAHNKRIAALTAPQARPLSEWHEDFGSVTWWTWKNGGWLGEPAYIGTPLDSDWPGYHTHWTPHPNFPARLTGEPSA